MSTFRGFRKMSGREPKQTGKHVPTPVIVVKPKRKRRRGPKLGALLKPKLMVKLRYVDTISIDPGAAATISHVFRANSIFDPDLTGTGHQPLLHDTYALLYERYRVVSSKLTVQPVPVGTGTVIPGFWGAFGDEDVTLTYTLATAIMEDSVRTGGKVRLDMGGAPTLEGDSRVTKPIVASFSAKKNLSADGELISHLFGANPTAGAADFSFHVWAGSIQGNNVGALNFIVEIEYIAELTDPIVVTQS